jgi:glycosyltransferase involved in cell wall biosynthesis
MIALVTEEKELAESTYLTCPRPTPWLFSTNGIAVRLFVTCWLVYALHFATNTVREIYPALALGDHLSFRVDEYAHMHPDLFEKEGYGWHIGNNPGASMLAAIPYALARPIIDPIVESVQRKRAASEQREPPTYNSPWPMAQEFYKEAWRRGLDIKFGLAAFVMQSMCMAPISSLAVVVMFFVLRRLFGSNRTAFWLALLYAFGTPVFFRTGYLNQNLMLGHFAFMGLVAMWNPGGNGWWTTRQRFFLGGLAGGAALLMDYSGVVLLLGLFCYGIISRVRTANKEDALHHGCWYILGALGPVCLLWLYQWRSFGHPLYPGQHWMPPVEWIELGYRGYGWPQFELLLSLAFDYRFGLFVSAPLLLLALLVPLYNRGARRLLPGLEMVTMLALFVGMWVFFSGSNYTRLQFNTGIRYLTAILPFLFIPAAIVLTRLPRFAIYLVAILSVTESWCLAMHRDVERGLGVLDPILQIFLGGFKLPVLTTLSNMGGQYGEFFSKGTSPLPFFFFAAAILYAIWARQPQVRVKVSGSASKDRDFALTNSNKAAAAKNQARQESAVTVDVVIPVLNEAHVLEQSVGTVRQFLGQCLTHRWRVVIVDNGSTDGTDRVAARLKMQFADVEFLQLPQRGRGRALRYAWMQSKADVVSYMDVDLSTSLQHLPQLIDAIIHEGYDIALGSRLLEGSQTRRSIRREVISRCYNIFLKSVLFTSFSDAQCGFKAVSRKVADHIVPQIEDQTWFFDTELLVLAEKQGYRIKDIPVVWNEDDDSRVKIVSTAWDDIKGVLRLRRQLWAASFANTPATRVKQRELS